LEEIIYRSWHSKNIGNLFKRSRNEAFDFTAQTRHFLFIWLKKQGIENARSVPGGQEQNLDLKIQALEKAGYGKIYTEIASGSKRDRPELINALDYMRPEDTLVVWKLDRLARSLKQLIEIIEILEKQNKGFRSLTEAIDTTTSGDRLVFHIFGALAEFERFIIRDRTTAGLDAAKLLGRTGGRPVLTLLLNLTTLLQPKIF
jgi:DNA invertase Pin-like site-specific DNA recombinase